MPLLEHLIRLAECNMWSNHRLHRACAQLSAEELAAERPSFFGSILVTLQHILWIDGRYLARLYGTDPEAVRQPPTTLTALTRAQLAADRDLVAYCRDLDEASLSAPVLIEADGRTWHDPVHAVLTHLFLHQTHHRGQVHGMLSATSVTPPQLDEFFLSQDRPRRTQEMHRLGLREPD